MLALTLTFGKGIWQSNDLPKDDAAMIEALPVAENLEFFKAMDVLDDLDLLESMGNQGDAARLTRGHNAVLRMGVGSHPRHLSGRFAATKDSEPPDREMLKMMELLREMEMIKQIDMLQDMQRLENSDPVKDSAAQKSAPGKKKETPK